MNYNYPTISTVNMDIHSINLELLDTRTRRDKLTKDMYENVSNAKSDVVETSIFRLYNNEIYKLDVEEERLKGEKERMMGMVPKVKR